MKSRKELHVTKIKILTGSARPGRFNPQPAQWIYELAKQRNDIEVELIDVAELKLPFLDESIPPSQGKYEKEHTKKWAAVINDADGFIFVTPEYNHSISPVLKNAIDYLYKEWNFKPVSYISYGSLAGGARSVEHLRGVAGELKMYDLREQLLIPNYWEQMDSNGQYQFTEKQELLAKQILDDTVFWAEQMKSARTRLADK